VSPRLALHHLKAVKGAYIYTVLTTAATFGVYYGHRPFLKLKGLVAFAIVYAVYRTVTPAHPAVYAQHRINEVQLFRLTRDGTYRAFLCTKGTAYTGICNLI
jgi:hypothetical protein